VRIPSIASAIFCEDPHGPLRLIDLEDVRYELKFDTQPAYDTPFQGGACDIQVSSEHQGATFKVTEIRAPRFPPAVEVLRIPAWIKSIAARSCCDGANLRALSLSPGSFL
jgi:hypothetical protein